MIIDENISQIKNEFDYTQVMEAKGILTYYNEFNEEKRKSRFMMSFCSHTLTDKSDQNLTTDPADLKNVVNGMTKTATTFLTTGINFVLPTNIFWNKVFCVMASCKSFVFLC